MFVYTFLFVYEMGGLVYELHQRVEVVRPFVEAVWRIHVQTETNMDVDHFNLIVRDVSRERREDFQLYEPYHKLLS